jgi:hypothetical protein
MLILGISELTRISHEEYIFHPSVFVLRTSPDKSGRFDAPVEYRIECPLDMHVMKN